MGKLGCGFHAAAALLLVLFSLCGAKQGADLPHHARLWVVPDPQGTGILLSLLYPHISARMGPLSLSLISPRDTSPPGDAASPQ